ncbi:MAG: hypothetical protein HN458_06350 [Euryarchaeota archaeon]|jgi:hypothetical protein|nr:hypothetical protein [Euryarchaeota archaeon]MDC3290436.1 hypothetical protein [Candidatus Poseidoniaceae archaeon]
MASLWQFFGLPNPDGTTNEKKPEKQASSPLKPAAALQTAKPTALTIPTVASTPAPSPAKTQLESTTELKLNIKTPPLQWKGPVTAEGEPFHDLGAHTPLRNPLPRRALRYVAPDSMNRIPTREMAKRVRQGDSIIVDLRPMVHMDTHQNVCRRELQQMGNDAGIGVFALDSEDKLLLLPGKDVVVDVGRHELGLQSLLSD